MFFAAFMTSVVWFKQLPQRGIIYELECIKFVQLSTIKSVGTKLEIPPSVNLIQRFLIKMLTYEKHLFVALRWFDFEFFG